MCDKFTKKYPNRILPINLYIPQDPSNFEPTYPTVKQNTLSQLQSIFKITTIEHISLKFFKFQDNGSKDKTIVHTLEARVSKRKTLVSISQLRIVKIPAKRTFRVHQDEVILSRSSPGKARAPSKLVKTGERCRLSQFRVGSRKGAQRGWLAGRTRRSARTPARKIVCSRTAPGSLAFFDAGRGRAGRVGCRRTGASSLGELHVRPRPRRTGSPRPTSVPPPGRSDLLLPAIWRS